VDVGGVGGSDEGVPGVVRVVVGRGGVIVVVGVPVGRPVVVMTVAVGLVVVPRPFATLVGRRERRALATEVDVGVPAARMHVRDDGRRRHRRPQRERRHQQRGEAEQAATGRHGRVAHSTVTRARSTGWPTPSLRGDGRDGWVVRTPPRETATAAQPAASGQWRRRRQPDERRA
jgi:hypothetical protein